MSVNTRTHLASPNSQKALDFAKNANFYDLINITLKASDNKLSFMDRYI